MRPFIIAPLAPSCSQVVMDLCQDILSKMPPLFDVEAVSQTYPTTYKESMNTVLTQASVWRTSACQFVKHHERASLGSPFLLAALACQVLSPRLAPLTTPLTCCRVRR